MKTEKPSFETIADACWLNMIAAVPEELFDAAEAVANSRGIPVCEYLRELVQRDVDRATNGFE